MDELDFRQLYMINDKGRKVATWSRSLYSCPGVYFIKEDDRLVYIGKGASNVQKTLYRHFQGWNDYRHWVGYGQFIDRVTYKDKLAFCSYLVSIVEFQSGEEAERAEKELIIRYNPRDNSRKYQAFQEQENFEPLKIENNAWKPIFDSDPF